MNCIFPGAVALILLAMAAPAAAQYVDPRTCDPGTAACDSAIRTQRDNDAAYEEQAQKNRAERERQRAAMLDKPPIPAKHNGLLGSWRLANSPQTSKGDLGREAGTGGLTDLVGILGSMNFATLACAPLSGGVSFGPSSYSRQGIDGRAQGAIAYRSVRSGAAPVIAAIPADGGVMVFEVASPDRIVGDDGCVLVRVGASAVNAPAAPGPSATSTASAAAVSRRNVREQLGIETVASVERDIKARGGSAGTLRAGSQSTATLSAMSGDYSDVGPYVTAVNYEFDGTGSAARLVAVTVVHSFGVFGDAYGKLAAERKAVLAQDFGVLQMKSATEFGGAAGRYELVLFENPDTGYLYEKYQLGR